MTLLLGPPGAEKTTLLLTLAGKLDKDLKIAGKLTYNGHIMDEFVPQRTSAYISQDDLHIGEMTVRETLAFSVRCQGVGTCYEMLTELSEKAANIKPDPDIDLDVKMWPKLIDLAKHGGLNVIETYVFWNIHEPVEGQLNFEGNNDLVNFIKTIKAAGMWACIKIGPNIEAEWNHGGFPYWLREVHNVTFCTDNEPFKHYMKKWIKYIVNMMKEEKLYASQGGQHGLLRL